MRSYHCSSAAWLIERAGFARGHGDPDCDLHQIVILTGYSTLLLSTRVSPVTGSTSITAVAPGISEALINTAAGLFAAIPAVYFYNHFTNRVKHFSGEMDDFSLEFLNISERNFT